MNGSDFGKEIPFSQLPRSDDVGTKVHISIHLLKIFAVFDFKIGVQNKELADMQSQLTERHRNS
ncbi:hypothetical protein D932_03588 [Enterococcus casseliflavus 14-MB-W-14]|nr:hypothetical protein D932_03588 [Enterococcus casseliflavus 14-MB-W-14]